MSERLRHLGVHLRRHGIAYAALTVAFSFSPLPAIAADLVTTGEIANGAVTSPKLANAAVTQAKLGADSVVSGKIFNETIGGVDIKNGAVGSADLADSSVLGVDVKDGSISQADVELGSLGGEHIAEGSIDSYNVADDGLRSVDIEDGSIQAVDLAPSAEGTKVVRYSIGSHDFSKVPEISVLLPGEWTYENRAVARSQWSGLGSKDYTYVTFPGGYYGDYYQLVVTVSGILRITLLEGSGSLITDIQIFRTFVSSGREVPRP